MDTHDPTRTEIRRASAHIFELLLDWFPDIIQSVDAKGNIIYANRRASELLGYSRAEILSLNIQQLYAPEILANVSRGFTALKETGNLRVIESLILDKAGTRIPVEIRSFAVYDQQGSFVRTFSILRDLRDIKALQNSLIHASRLAAIGELAACVAHDISNPLAVIKLYTELMETQVEQIAAAAADDLGVKGLDEGLASIQKSADRIERLVNHLRGFCRSTEGEMTLVDLCRVIDDALFMVTNKIQKGNVSVVRDYPADSSFSVRGHANQLEQVFMNLASNACDAVRDRERPEIRIRLTQSRPAGKPPTVECSVTDNGVGMPPEVKSQIFSSFFTTKPKGEGTGLGLAIARNIVRRHGGDITVESVPGEGTTFVVSLPAFQAVPSSEEARQDEPA